MAMLCFDRFCIACIDSSRFVSNTHRRNGPGADVAASTRSEAMNPSMRPIAWACRALCAGLVSMPWLTALAQDSTQRVEITGSSIKRTDAETALPVQVISRKEIAASGVVNVEQLLQTVSAMTSSGATVNSSASGATTGGLSGISLRGLTSIRTLVLINGHRTASASSATRCRWTSIRSRCRRSNASRC
jgi:outer membrane receptor for ferrienterochelin and colicin